MPGSIEFYEDGFARRELAEVFGGEVLVPPGASDTLMVFERLTQAIRDAREGGGFPSCRGGEEGEESWLPGVRVKESGGVCVFENFHE